MATTHREPWYITRESVQRALDVASGRRSSTRIDECIAAGSRDVDGLCHRVFYPWTGTRMFDRSRSNPGRLWLDAAELVAVTAVTSGGDTVTDYLLEPSRYGPPYSRLDINLSGTGSFPAGETWQQDIAITGTYGGCPIVEKSAGQLTAAINAATDEMVVTDGSRVEVGHVVRIGDERLQVVEKTAEATLSLVGTGGIAANNGATLLPLSDPTAIQPGEVILVDAERLLVTDVAGTNAVVQRAWDGTVLSAHLAGVTVYAYRRCRITRGDLGTTAAAHDTAAALNVLVPPPLVSELTMAYTMTALTQGKSSYSQTIGSGDNQRESTGRGVQAIEADCARAHQRRGRMRSV